MQRCGLPRVLEYCCQDEWEAVSVADQTKMLKKIVKDTQEIIRTGKVPTADNPIENMAELKKWVEEKKDRFVDGIKQDEIYIMIEVLEKINELEASVKNFIQTIRDGEVCFNDKHCPRCHAIHKLREILGGG